MRRSPVPILVGLGLSVLVLGTIGFLTCDPGLGLATALYRSVQLFYWNYFPWNTTLEARIPWMLEVARWLAPAVTLGAIFQVAAGSLRRRWHAFRAGRMSGHVVVCGVGQTGFPLTQDLILHGRRVVAIEPQPAKLGHAIALGAVGIDGGDDGAAAFRYAGIDRSSALVICTGDDHRNLNLGLRASTMGAKDIRVESSLPGLADLYRHTRLSGFAGTPIRGFSRPRNMARAALRELLPIPPDGTSFHMVLPDVGPLSAALAVEAALVGHFAEGRCVHIHLASGQSASGLETLIAGHPGIRLCASLSLVDFERAEDFVPAVEHRIAQSPSDSWLVFTGFGSGGAPLSRALQLVATGAIVGCSRVIIPGGSHLPFSPEESARTLLDRGVALLPPESIACGVEAVLGNALDCMARRIHENWLADTKSRVARLRAGGDEAAAQAHEAKPAFRPWDDLDEIQKGASRSQADHLPIKLKTAGLDLKTATARDWNALPASMLEELARMEHARWCSYLWMTGWEFAPERNDAAKLHPDLVPYEQLSEPTKDYDRAAVRNVAQFLGQRL